MHLSTAHIYSIINNIGIHTNNKVTNNWLQILCPNPAHNDKHYGNASINLSTGYINCFACGFNISIVKYIKEFHNISFKEMKTTLNINDDNQCNTTYKKKEKIIKKTLNYDFSYIPLNPDNFLYTKLRGFTKEFCEQFSILHCISGIYNDYFIIPIIDTKKSISIYEARRLKEFETLVSFFNIKRIGNTELLYKKLKLKFDAFVKDKAIHRDKQLYKIIDADNNVYYDYNLEYLLQKKVLYPHETNPKLTLWNIDNLDFNNDLYLVEGIGSIPKIYTNISNNATCLFGAIVYPDQIKYLQEFKQKIIYIPDNDIAGFNSIESLHNGLKNLYVKDIGNVKDTDKNYIDTIAKKESQKSNEFLAYKEIVRKIGGIMKPKIF